MLLRMQFTLKQFLSIYGIKICIVESRFPFLLFSYMQSFALKKSFWLRKLGTVVLGFCVCC